MKNKILTILILITAQNVSYSEDIKTFIQDTISVEATKYNSIYPADVISMDAIKLEKNNIRNLNGTLGGVFISDYGSSVSGNIYYRGFGNRYNGSGVSLFIDGIPMLSGTETSAMLFNVNEVAIGQQNINHSGLSAIDITTKSAIKEKEIDMLVEFGNYNALGYNFSLNNKVTDKYYFGAYQRTYYYDGWEKNYFSNSNYEINYSGGIRLEGELFNNVYSLTKLDISGTKEDGFPYRNMVDGVLLPLRFNDASNYRNTLAMFTEKLDFKLSEKLYLLSLTSYSFLKDEMFLDQDFSEEDIFTLNQKQKRHRITQEIRFHINNSKDFNHTIGFFGSHENNSPYSADVTFKREGIEKMIENNITANLPAFVNYKIMNNNFLIPNNFEDKKLFASSYYNFIFNNLFTKNLSFEGTLKFDYLNNKLDYDVSSSLLQYYNITQFGMTIEDGVIAEYKADGTTTKNYFQFSPKVLFSYKINQKNKLFGSFVRGYKNGGYNVQMLSDVVQNNLRTKMIDGLKESILEKLLDAGMPEAQIQSMILSRFPTFYYYNGDIGDVLYYKPEENYSVELGYNKIFNSCLELTAKLFFITINQLQLTQFSPNGFGRMLVNSGEANSKGAEININYQPIDELVLRLNYNFADARFTKYYDTTIINDTIEVVDYSKNRIPYTPNQMFNFSATYTHKLQNKIIKDIYLGAEYSGAAGIFWNETNSLSQDYYGIINAKLGAKIYNCTIEFFGKNITNERYYTFYFESLSKDFYQLARPFQFGLKIFYKM